jgi:GntR family transcriptional regulator
MQIKLDFRSKTPIYVQIIDQTKHLIATGVLRPDDQLPTIRQLAVDLKVNFTTVARAYRILDDDGLISTQHGRGTYVLPPASKQDLTDLRRDDLERLTDEYLSAVDALGYSPAEVSLLINEYIQHWEENGFLPPINTER